VPFPHAVDDHQTANARYLTDAGAALLLPQGELDAATLAARLEALLAEDGGLARMAAAARSRALPEATRRVAERCLEAARG